MKISCIWIFLLQRYILVIEQIPHSVNGPKSFLEHITVVCSAFGQSPMTPCSKSSQEKFDRYDLTGVFHGRGPWVYNSPSLSSWSAGYLLLVVCATALADGLTITAKRQTKEKIEYVNIVKPIIFLSCTSFESGFLFLFCEDFSFFELTS